MSDVQTSVPADDVLQRLGAQVIGLQLATEEHSKAKTALEDLRNRLGNERHQLDALRGTLDLRGKELTTGEAQLAQAKKAFEQDMTDLASKHRLADAKSAELQVREEKIRDGEKNLRDRQGEFRQLINRLVVYERRPDGLPRFRARPGAVPSDRRLCLGLRRDVRGVS